MNRLFYGIMIFAGIGIMMLGCYPKGPEYYSDLDITATQYDEDFKSDDGFSNSKYYWMPDSVNIQGNLDITDTERRELEALILGELETQMGQRGYDRVDSAQKDIVDLIISSDVIGVNNSGAGWIPGGGWGWWGGGGWYYPPYWGGWYPYYYSYTTGTVITTMGYIKDLDPDEENIPAVWMSVYDGLMSSTRSNNRDRATKSIQQSFTQSPYLESTK